MDSSAPLRDLLARWEEEAAVLERTGHEAHARDLRRRIEAVQDAWGRITRIWLGTEEAASWSGYSEDHLRALAQEGRVEARKEGGSWRFLRSSLPRKPRRSREGGERPSHRAARRAMEGS